MNAKQVEEALLNYHWMLNTIKMMRESMNDIGGGVAQYGEEAAMPKAQGGTSDVVYNEVARRGKNWRRIAEYEKKIHHIQMRITLITDHREAEVLHWILEGKSMRWISLNMNVSDTTIRRIKDDIVKKMAE